jgi:hypothetical protein
MLQDRYNRRTPVPAIIPALIKQMNDLIEIMAAERLLVTGRKFAEHEQLLKRKQKMTLEYRATIKSLMAQKDILKALPSDVHRSLKLTAQKLNDTAEDNARSLRAAVTAVQRLIQNIVAHIKSEVLTTPGYKNPKTSYLELGNYSPTCKPVAVSRSV